MARDCKAPKAEPVLNAAKGKRPAAQGRVYAITGTDAEDTNELIQGTCTIAGTPLVVLFDSGATHSFISVECVRRLGLPVVELPYDLVVSTPATNSLVTRTTCLQCPLIFEERNFLANLVCLELVQLDVILGMDWLAQHHVLLDYTSKKVMFPDKGVSDYLNSNFWKKASLVFLNSIVAEVKNDGDVGKITIVQDYADVFPKDVPGIPPVRETEFSIDVIPGTGPISITPYRMAPAEMK